jgi:hypothetical protein
MALSHARGAADHPMADGDYRTFKTIQPIFDESLFPDKVPEGNRAFKGWFRGLFR